MHRWCLAGNLVTMIAAVVTLVVAKILMIGDVARPGSIGRHRTCFLVPSMWKGAVDQPAVARVPVIAKKGPLLIGASPTKQASQTDQRSSDTYHQTFPNQRDLLGLRSPPLALNGHDPM